MIWMIIGFVLACYAVIGNDSIQTIGTFLASNKSKNWLVIWGYFATILTVVLVYGWVKYSGDVSYGRLGRIPIAEQIQWWHVLPMLALMLLTRVGIPVSTTFMALSIFTGGSIVLEKIITKSLVGYGVAFLATFIVWIGLSYFERQVLNGRRDKKISPIWTLLQWASTGFLWSQWLIQDLANIYVYAPRDLPLWMLIASLVLLLSLLALIVREKGGKIQQIVEVKTNTLDVRSATFIDFTYGLTLYIFKTVNDLPMSTTWVFLGTLAGREIILSMMLKHKGMKTSFKDVGSDLGKATIGLVISVLIAVGVRYLFV